MSARWTGNSGGWASVRSAGTRQNAAAPRGGSPPQCRNRNSFEFSSAQWTSSHALRLSGFLATYSIAVLTSAAVGGRDSVARYSSFRISRSDVFFSSSRPTRFVGVAQLLVDRRAVDELQRLGQVAVALALALAGQFAGRLAERLQERMIGVAVGQLHRARPGRHAGELLRHLRRLADRVEQLLRRQQLRHRVREILVVVAC